MTETEDQRWNKLYIMDKVIRVIRSCKTIAQLESAERLVGLSMKTLDADMVNDLETAHGLLWINIATGKKP